MGRAELDRRVAELADQEWIVEVSRGEDGYFASVLELPGCMSAAETWEELEPAVRESIEVWPESALEHGDPIPEPRAHAGSYSGALRRADVSSLHRAIARRAAGEGPA